MKVVF